MITSEQRWIVLDIDLVQGVKMPDTGALHGGLGFLAKVTAGS